MVVVVVDECGRGSRGAGQLDECWSFLPREARGVGEGTRNESNREEPVGTRQRRSVSPIPISPSAASHRV